MTELGGQRKHFDEKRNHGALAKKIVEFPNKRVSPNCKTHLLILKGPNSIIIP